MIEINVSKEQLERAKNLYEFKVLNNSLSKGKGNLIGAIGEIVLFDYYTNKGKNVVHAQDFEYDLIIEKYKVECKTQSSNYTPKSNYDCKLSTFNDSQNCDYYCFLHVLKDFSKVWIKGMLSKEDLNQLKILKKKGERCDVYKDFIFPEDTWIVKNHQLKKIN